MLLMIFCEYQLGITDEIRTQRGITRTGIVSAHRQRYMT